SNEGKVGMRPGLALAAGGWVSDPDLNYGTEMTMKLLFQDTDNRVRFLSSSITADGQTPWKVDEDDNLLLHASPDTPLAFTLFYYRQRRTLLFRRCYHKDPESSGSCLQEWIKVRHSRGGGGFSNQCI